MAMFLFATSVTLFGQRIGVKNNILYDATATPNLGLEIALHPRWTLEVGSGVNLFTFSDNKKFRHLLIQPELRWWQCEVFNGHFIGLHGHAAQFNVGKWDIPAGRLTAFKDNRYEGYLYGGGLSYGYQWLLSPRWNLEFNLGGGFARIHYDKYPCTACGTKLDEGEHNYWGVTKAAVSLIFLIK